MGSLNRLTAAVRMILRSTACLALCCGFCYAVLLVEMDWNFITWTPKFDRDVALSLAIAAPVLTGMGFLAYTDRYRVTRVVAVMLCSLVLAFGVCMLYADAAQQGQWFVPDTPVWYKTCRTIMVLLPLVAWSLGTWTTCIRDAERTNRPVRGAS